MASHWPAMVENLEEQGVLFEEGLSEGELTAIENQFCFQFPPGLSAFLKCALPVGGTSDFPDWRNGAEDKLRAMLELPFNEVLFDVEHNHFWLPEWGERPNTFDVAKEKLRELIASAPKLIPVLGSHMIPDRPYLVGNPVFAIRQTDIVHYGCDLRDWFLRAFLCKSEIGLWPMPLETLRDIEFWNPSRFATRWEKGPIKFDNSKGWLP